MRSLFHGVTLFTLTSKPLVPNMQCPNVTHANFRTIPHSPAAQSYLQTPRSKTCQLLDGIHNGQQITPVTWKRNSSGFQHNTVPRTEVREILLLNHKLRVTIPYGVQNSLYEYSTYFLKVVCSSIAHVLTQFWWGYLRKRATWKTYA